MKKRIPMKIEPAPTPQRTGKEYWRSLAQLAQTDEFKQRLHNEFPEGAQEMGNDWSRRSFLTLMGASIALAGLSGCRRPVEKIVPYVRRPEEIMPGRPLMYATNMPFGTKSYGVLARANDGRPTKLEGNAEHPSTLGGTNIFIQAAILGLYDPDRAKQPIDGRTKSDWDSFIDYWRSEPHTKYLDNGGRGLAVLSESFASPTLARLKEEFADTFPNATWAAYEPISDENIYDGLELATGQVYQPVHHFDRADIIMSLESDFLERDGNPVTNARGFAAKRKVESQDDTMSRLYVAESCYTITGSMADHRYRLKSSQIGAFTVALARELESQGLTINGLGDVSVDTTQFDQKWLRVAASDLRAAGANAIVLAGAGQPAWVHALVFAMNEALGANGATVTYHAMRDVARPRRSELKALVDAMNAGSVETLIILGGNPVYNAPVDVGFATALNKVNTAIHLSDHVDETSRACRWQLPRTHFLEAWGDVRATDGTLGVVQPLIEPLFEARSDIEVLTLIVRGTSQPGYEVVRETWRSVLGARGFEDRWRVVLHDGLQRDSAIDSSSPRLRASAVARAISLPQPSDGLEVTFRPSNVFDGRFANNGWLHELPDAMSKLAWDNAALMSHGTAKELGVENEDTIRIDLGGRSLETVVWVSPGHADQAITLLLGYGREQLGRVADGVGANAYRLRTLAHPLFATGGAAQRTGGKHLLANTQDHGSMEGRPLVREATLAEYKEADKPHFYPEAPHHPPLVPLWDPHTYQEGYQWGMSIDLNSCIGCNACAVACQSENNIPIVGQEQVRNGREMHWLRLDRYYASNPDDPNGLDEPEVAFQPMACQHCEYAPCESVCPVAATVHDEEGLNVMVYNRCIGTRYCSNNCPYKVRRFNFFNYTNDYPEIHKMTQNPDVTVRSRGVMEKCTYCIQRISAAKITAKAEGRTVTDDDLQTACQQACPADAIVFGNINDPESRVSKMKKINRDYQVLQEYNLKPRTSYLARLRNPHPELAPKVDRGHKGDHGGGH
ncbi:4Fe-4S dicluster domain-containing protein [candidate division GN15 bacterium]|nr:4Fe-4S dicluster domain-containing protein [candidate division GN15 bacterium]